MTPAPTGTAPTATRPFGTVLVANRGEIACRVIRTLRRLGIRSVAVYSDADRDAPHVALADLAVRVGPAPASASYLDIDAILSAAAVSGADAIHPGYGFLSENAALAEACERADVVFVGPGVRALTVMGDKIAAKQHVEAHGVATTPGVAEPGLTDAQLEAAADRIGYPVLVKPSAGGGGKGMQAVRSPEALPEALAAARRVAAAAFGDDTLFLERLVESPRHIEVQILADRHGNVVHLGERECSLQRRHQKVIEEAPSPLLDDATRSRIGEAACQVAASVDYVGAGTVEFLVSDAAPDEFFFMEMNTRLQVEHPVTELVTGLDLVEWQLRIAAGEPLSFAQDDVHLSGHAIEARVYAENPERGFLPSGGRVLALDEPAGDGIRVDSGVTAGMPIVTEYDPMLSKIVAWGESRATALARLDAALAGTSILGAVTNIRWLRDLLADEDVRAGRMDTTLIDRRFSDAAVSEPTTRELIAAAAIAHRERWDARPAGAGALWGAPTGWRMAAPRPVAYDLGTARVLLSGGPDELAAGTARATVSPDGASAAADHTVGLRIEGPAMPGRACVAVLSLDGVTSAVTFACDGATVWLGQGGGTRALRILDRPERLARELAARTRVEGQADPGLRSPMPGTVVGVAARNGARVEAGDTVLTVEAMKMEHRILAPVAGTVQVHVSRGDLVKLDQLVAVVDPDEPDDAPRTAARLRTEPTPSAAVQG